MGAEKQKFHVNLQWCASKDTIAGFLYSAEDFARYINLDFRTSNIEPIGHLIQTLGHQGRGLSDFPNIMKLDIPYISKGRLPIKSWQERPDILVTTTFNDLFVPVEIAVVDYIENVYRKRHEAREFQKEIDCFNLLMQHLGDVTVQATFGHMYERLYEVSALKAENGIEYTTL